VLAGGVLTSLFIVTGLGATAATAGAGCTTHGTTLSVRAGGGRGFLLICTTTAITDVAASCGTVTQSATFETLYFYEANACTGAQTFGWKADGVPFQEQMNVGTNGNEPPECDPVTPNPLLVGLDGTAPGSLFCIDFDFTGPLSSNDFDSFSVTHPNPERGSLSDFGHPDDETLTFSYTPDRGQFAGADQFDFAVTDDFAANPKTRLAEAVVKMPPNTLITSGPDGRTRDRTPKFKFKVKPRSGAATFLCKLDGKPYADCDSPQTYGKKLDFGRHTFRVRGTSHGSTDPSAAKRRFKIVH
jgi:hypothetical protein